MAEEGDTEHVNNALIKASEEKLRLEVSIPRKLEDDWDPMVKLKLIIFLVMLYVILELVPPLCQRDFMTCLN